MTVIARIGAVRTGITKRTPARIMGGRRITALFRVLSRRPVIVPGPDGAGVVPARPARVREAPMDSIPGSAPLDGEARPGGRDARGSTDVAPDRWGGIPAAWSASRPRGRQR